jgi:hypothetical protein
MTNVHIINNVPGIDVNVDSAGNNLCITIIPKSGKRLKDYKPGEIAKLSSREYIVLEHKDVFMTAVLDRNVATEMEFGKNANWVGSDVESYCEGEYYNELAKVVGKENIIPHTVNLMCDDGSNKNATTKNRISVLTPELYRKYREIIPLVDKTCWTPNGVTVLDDDYSRDVYVVHYDGVLCWRDCGCTSGVRPFCILNSNVLTS